MSFDKSINLLRKKITKALFVKAFNKSTSKIKTLENPEEIKKILIVRPNQRLGNQLLITPLIQEVLTLFPNAKIDLFLKGGIGKTVFKNYNKIDKIITLPLKPFKELLQYISCFISLRKQKYDLVINTVSYSSSGTIATKIARSKYKLFGIVKNEEFPNYNDYLHNAKRPVYDFREGIKSIGLDIPQKQIPKIDIKLDANELEQGRIKLKEIINNSKKIICIFTYATRNKMYDKDWWSNFYTHLKDSFATYTIIEVLPAENISQINFIAPTFYSKDIREIAALISNTALFIGADSGIMHLSSATNTTTIGLFSVTDLNIYQPYSNKNFGINTNNKSVNEIIEKIKQVV
ncbi:glycosyltransferase family 9 protein [Flavobacterium sp. HNIBRBA15423]|uniref:glycosyltransferase family 9 protein n=1 Tax=Flavobacterium sp. HNIBRBA15423 TaxID=3458683 RepID=UPI00404426C7